MKSYLSLVKFSHTIFALPFALLGFFLATLQSHIVFDWTKLGLVILCMVFARSAAMAFNRYLDRDIDLKNPRTAVREIPSGIITAKSALIFVILNCLAFIITTYFINPLCLILSPIALMVVLFYSYTKRFTSLCHFVLGLGLSLAPIGAYLAAGGSFDFIPLLYSASVLLWVSGFDIIYALQDEDFDRSLDLHSIPVLMGTKKALQLSTFLHIICAILIFTASYSLYHAYPHFNFLLWIGTFIFIGLLFYQHTLVKVDDLQKVNLAFFTTNGIASVLLGGMIILDLFV